MAHNGSNPFADRAVGIDVHAPAGNDKCRVYLLRTGDISDIDIWAVRLRLGMSYPRTSGSMCVAFEKDRVYATSVSVETVSFCAACGRTLYVRVADLQPTFLGTRNRPGDPPVYKSPYYD